MSDLGIVIGLFLSIAISGNAIVKHEYEIAGRLPHLSSSVRSAGVAALPSVPHAAPAGAHAHENLSAGSR